MSTGETGQAAWPRYDLPLGSDDDDNNADDLPEGHVPSYLVLANLEWFIRVRWVAGVLLLLFGAASWVVAEGWEVLGLNPRAVWPLGLGGCVLVANAGTHLHARAVARDSRHRYADANLWVQIVLDLLFVTVLVHCAGSIETPAPFMYLFHVVLACIFFPRRRSLVVVVMAVALYTGCVLLESVGVVRPGSLYATDAAREVLTTVPAGPLVSAVVTSVTLVIVWAMASHLAARAHRREHQLASTNRQMRRAQAEKQRHMLRTTHELKAPFAAVASNAQLLLRGNCGPLPDKAVEVLQRIHARCRRLGHEIQEMLQLANLQSQSERPLPRELDLADVVKWAVAQSGGPARARSITVEEDLAPTPVLAVEDHMRMLVGNLLANAVAYSREGGRVRVRCGLQDGAAVAVVEDQGIGIPEEKLPRIFEEYFRTDEAAQHNKDSSGLGLAIARHVVRGHDIRLAVESRLGHGTRFTMHFPPRTTNP
jgi:signal transduction histidine kinase